MLGHRCWYHWEYHWQICSLVLALPTRQFLDTTCWYHCKSWILDESTSGFLSFGWSFRTRSDVFLLMGSWNLTFIFIFKSEFEKMNSHSHFLHRRFCKEDFAEHFLQLHLYSKANSYRCNAILMQILQGRFCWTILTIIVIFKSEFVKPKVKFPTLIDAWLNFRLFSNNQYIEFSYQKSGDAILVHFKSVDIQFWVRS
jgi:hypothetical protein